MALAIPSLSDKQAQLFGLSQDIVFPPIPLCPHELYMCFLVLGLPGHINTHACILKRTLPLHPSKERMRLVGRAERQRGS